MNPDPILIDLSTKVMGYRNPVLFCLRLLENQAGNMLGGILDRESFLRAAKDYEDNDWTLEHVWTGEEGEVMELIRELGNEHRFAIWIVNGKIEMRGGRCSQTL